LSVNSIKNPDTEAIAVVYKNSLFLAEIYAVGSPGEIKELINLFEAGQWGVFLQMSVSANENLHTSYSLVEKSIFS